MKSAVAPSQKVVNSLGPGRENGPFEMVPFTHWPQKDSSLEPLRSLKTPKPFSSYTDIFIFLNTVAYTAIILQTVSDTLVMRLTDYMPCRNTQHSVPEASLAFVVEESHIYRRKVILVFSF